MNQTVCNNQPPSILLVDIPHSIKGTARMILYRDTEAEVLWSGKGAAMGFLCMQAAKLALKAKPAMVVVSGPAQHVINDIRNLSGVSAIYHHP